MLDLAAGIRFSGAQRTCRRRRSGRHQVTVVDDPLIRDLGSPLDEMPIASQQPARAVLRAEAAAGHDDQSDVARGSGRWHTFHPHAVEGDDGDPHYFPLTCDSPRGRLRFTCAEVPRVDGLPGSRVRTAACSAVRNKQPAQHESLPAAAVRAGGRPPLCRVSEGPSSLPPAGTGRLGKKPGTSQDDATTTDAWSREV